MADTAMVTYRPANGAGSITLKVGHRHDWDRVAEFCAGALGLKVADKDPVFDQIMARRAKAKR